MPHTVLAPNFTEAPGQTPGLQDDPNANRSVPAPTQSVPEANQSIPLEPVAVPVPSPVFDADGFLPEEPQRDISFKDLMPTRFISREDVAAFEKSKEANIPGIIEATKAAFEIEATFSYLFQNSPELVPDDNYQITKERFKELTEGLPKDLHNVFDEAVSDGHATVLRNKMIRIVGLEKRLAEFGWSGIGLRMLAAILDPSALAVSVVTDGLAAPYIYGGKITRFAMILRAGLTASATNAGIEAYLVTQNPVKDPLDILFAATGGMVLGGAIGGLIGKARPRQLTKELAIMEDMNNEILKREIVEVGGVLNENGIERLSPSARAIELADVADQNVSAGAQQVEGSFIPESDLLKANTDEFLALHADAPMTMWSEVRIDMAAALKGSSFGPSRALGNVLLEDGLGNKGGIALAKTADLDKTIMFKRTMLDYQQVYQPAYREWAADQGLGAIKRAAPENRARFGGEVADAIENPDFKTYHPAVVKAAAKQAELSKRLLKDLRDAGVKGFENIPDDVKYFTRRWRYDRIVKATQTRGAPAVINLFKGAIMRASADMPEELAERIAKGMSRTLRKAHYGRDNDFGRIFSQDGRQALREMLDDEGIVSADDFDEVFKQFDDLQKGTGKPSIAKFRMRLDTTYELDGLSIRSLLDRDAGSVFESYASQATGRIALARRAGIKSDADLITIKDNMIAGADEVGYEKINRDLRIIDVSTSLILGRPATGQFLDPTANPSRILRLVMDYNFIRVMGQVGFAQIPELANVLGQGGVRTLLQQIPEFGSMLRSARRGQHDTVSAEIEAFTGGGRDRMIHQASLRHDPEDSLIAADDLIGKLSSLAQIGRRFVADTSAMAPITDFSSRVAGRTIVQNITDQAFDKGGKLSSKRLLDMGLNEDTVKKVYAQIREFGAFEDSVMFGNKKIRRINLEEWTDEAARDDFIFAVTRTTRRWIQQNDVGNLSKFMTDSLGKMLVQFRVFSIIAYNKQFLYGLHNRDMRTTISWLGAMFLASISYIAQQSINSIGQDDPKGWLRDRLTIKEIAKAGFQRAGFTTLFPAGIDFVGGFFYDEPIFAYGRTTGLAADLLTGNPTVDLLYKAQFAAQGFTRALVNDDFELSQTDLRNAKSVLPFHTLTGVRNVLSAIGNDLPRRSR